MILIVHFARFRFMLQALASIRWTGEKETFFRQIVEKVNRILQKILSRPENHVSATDIDLWQLAILEFSLKLCRLLVPFCQKAFILRIFDRQTILY